MYKLKLTRREKTRLLRSKWLIGGVTVLGLGVIVWLAWVRPMQHAAITSFAACAAAGNPIQKSYPEFCLTKDGKRFVNPKHNKARQDSQQEAENLVPPTNPALLNLDIEEWGIRIPLTKEAFDLQYGYIEAGGEEHVSFTYKRLTRKDVCKGTIGLRLTRSAMQNQPPYTPDKPVATASVGRFFYYVVYDEAPCYDAEDPEQVALVTQITGDKSLSEVTANLLAKMTAIPLQ